MTPKEALQKLAEGIFKHGEIGSGDGCFLPSIYAPIDRKDSEFVQISDALYEQFKATHFSRVWQVKGKFVKIDLWHGDGFGACLDMKIIHTETIKVGK